MTGTALDQGRLREAFARFPSGVAVLAAVVEGAPQVLVVSSFTVGVSLEPPLVAFAVQNGSGTWPLLKRAGSLGVSVLGAEHGELCRQLASREKEARLVNDPLRRMDSGALIVPDTPLRLWCRVHDEFPAGDHTMVLLEVLDVDGDTVGDLAGEPLVFHGSAFRRLKEPS